MMGRTHCASAVAVTATTATVGALIGDPWQPCLLVACVGVVAGASLLPDLDTTSSTAAWSAWPLSWLVALGMKWLSRGTYLLTRSRRRDPHARHPHRTFTHTLVFAGLAGGGAAAGMHCGGQTGVMSVLAVTLNLMLRAAGPKTFRHRAGFLLSVPTSVGLAWALSRLGLDAARSWPALATAVAAGCVVHCLGDLPTNSGVPLLWPIPIRGRLWYRITGPKSIRFCTDGDLERTKIFPRLAFIAGLACSAAAVATALSPLLPWA